jgi:hypothetical protein
MTLADATRPADVPASPSRRRGQRLVIGVSIAVLLAAGGVIGGTYYYDSVPLPESAVTYPVVSVAELPLANAFVAAVDPGFYESDDSLITRRYTEIAAGGGEQSSWRSRIMVDKAEAAYPKAEILDRYLNRADYGRGAVGLVAAAQTYFGKAPTQLTIAEAALLAVQLDPDHPDPRVGWIQVLDTMVDHDWLSQADRDGLAFPG